MPSTGGAAKLIGSGSDMTVFGEHLTTVKDPTKEIGPGLLHAMLNQLGLTKDDLP